MKHMIDSQKEEQISQQKCLFLFPFLKTKQMSKEKYGEAVKYIDEIKERFGDSTKMINMKISCYMLQQKWGDAYSLAEKLFAAMSSKEDLFDTRELEVVLSNLIVLGEIVDKQNPEHYKYLVQANKNAPFIKRFSEFNSNYQDMSEKLSIK